MAYSTIDKSSLHFNTKLYTGTGSSNAITGVGFQPDFTWIKKRSGAENNALFDAVRGVTKYLKSDETASEVTEASSLSAFGTDGFTVVSSGKTNTSSATYASWNWKANGAGSSNTDGSITATVSANTTAGFSIIKYTGTGANATVGHGLGVAPNVVITKNLNTATNYPVLHTSYTGGAGALNEDTAFSGSFSTYFNAVPTSSVVNIGTTDGANKSGDDIIMYAFAEKTGYSKFGSYAGNNSADGPFIYTGFKPAWVMVKKYSATNHWIIWDNKRSTPIDGANIINKKLYANLSNAENGADDISFLSNGFKFHTNTGDWNESQSYIYMAFGQSLVGSNNVPCTAR